MRRKIEKSNSEHHLPRIFTTIKDFLQLSGWHPSMLRQLREVNPLVVRQSSRPDLLEILRTIGKIGVENMEVIDGAYEAKRLDRARADEQEMLNTQHRGELLFSRDKRKAISELAATEILFEQFLAPFKKDVMKQLKLGPMTQDQFEKLLARHEIGLSPEIEDGV